MRNFVRVSPKPRTIAIVLAIPILLILVCFTFRLLGLGVASSYWMQEIETRGWRVLYSKHTGGHLVAICDAGANRLAVINTDWPIVNYPSTAFMDSQHHGITAGGFDLLQCNDGLIINRVTGCIVRVKVPEDGRIRIVQRALNGEILLDVELDWNTTQPMEKP